MSSHDSHPESRRDYDLVFNAETCRALRKKGYEAARVLVPTITVLLFLFSAALTGVLSVLSPRAELIVSVVASLVFAKVFVAELRWFDAVPTRETLREAWTEMNRDLHRQASVYAGDPEAIEAEVLDDTSDPNARPELAFGLAPEECFIVFGIPLVVLFIAVGDFEGLAAILSVGACIALSGALFVFVTHSSAKANTYPPEDPP